MDTREAFVVLEGLLEGFQAGDNLIVGIHLGFTITVVILYGVTVQFPRGRMFAQEQRIQDTVGVDIAPVNGEDGLQERVRKIFIQDFFGIAQGILV